MFHRYENGRRGFSERSTALVKKQGKVSQGNERKQGKVTAGVVVGSFGAVRVGGVRPAGVAGRSLGHISAAGRGNRVVYLGTADRGGRGVAAVGCGGRDVAGTAARQGTGAGATVCRRQQCLPVAVGAAAPFHGDRICLGQRV